ncbi:MAG: trypsin-like peptidase domain-containing protein [Candidatus Brocadiales bacterium]
MKTFILAAFVIILFATVVINLPTGSRRNEGAEQEGPTFERRNAVVIAVEKAGPAVANISTERMVTVGRVGPSFMDRDEFFENFFKDFFGAYEEKKVETPLGSGVIIDPEGYIVTNEHVISRATKIIVTLSDGSTYDAELISSDHASDLAVLKVDSTEPFPYVKMGTSEDLMIGESVVALGNPFGFKNSVTIGVVSATDRSLSFPGTSGEGKYEGLIQTDALINPGNSGGPLVNINGELIGINAAIIGAAQGIGFAIPVDKVRKTLIKLFDFQRINRVWLGAAVEELPKAQQGVRISAIEQDSPADEAGLREDDIVLEIDGRVVVEVLEFEKYLLKKEAGDRLDIVVERGGRPRGFSLELGDVPVPSAVELARARLGVDVQELTPEIAEHLGLWWVKGGVLITDVESAGPAGKIGIKPDYVIRSLGEYKVSSLEQLALLLEKVESGQIVDMGLAWADGFGARQVYVRLRAR